MKELQIGQLAQDIYNGFLGYSGATTLIRHPYAQDLIKRLEIENTGPARIPIERIVRSDGSAAYFDLSHAVKYCDKATLSRDS